MTLENQVAIVTGASSGIGRATAERLAAAGAAVVINHLPRPSSTTEAEEVVRAIERAGGEAVAIAADVADEAQVESMLAQTVANFGTIHIMVSNAGIERPAAIQDMTLGTWRQVLDVNLTGAFLCARGAAREFLRRGLQPEISRSVGKIIFTSSVHEVIPWAFQSNYAASKGGLSLLMKSLAQELAPAKIRVNSVAPGAVRTAINTHAWETGEALNRLHRLIPYGRIGDPEDIARAVAWLASDDSDYVVGTSLLIDGGMSLYPAFRDAG
jgi:glucose 1-dehydrogenase